MPTDTIPKAGDYCCVSIGWLRHWGIPIPNVMGWLIRFFTWSRYDHCFVYVGNGEIVEAQWSGAKLSPLSKYSRAKQRWSTTVLTDAERQEIVANSKSKIGTPYGFLDILGLGYTQLGMPVPDWLLVRVISSRRMICSQLVAWCGQVAEVDAWLCGQQDSQFVTPGMLADLAEGKKPE